MNIFSSGRDRVIAVCDSVALYTLIKMIKCSNSNLEGNVRSSSLISIFTETLGEGIIDMTDLHAVSFGRHSCYLG